MGKRLKSENSEMKKSGVSRMVKKPFTFLETTA